MVYAWVQDVLWCLRCLAPYGVSVGRLRNDLLLVMAEERELSSFGSNLLLRICEYEHVDTPAREIKQALRREFLSFF